MKLKSLTIQGFKSFPDKVVFTFPTDITAVVGPNGSGKSNVVDAFRWVLGGQSMKTLRGKKSQDLIFLGSKKKKRLGMGRVILEMTEATEKETGYPFKTLVIERRIYQDGSTVNFINKNSVRLKDIQQLAFRANLSDDSLSIINQGQTDEFLRASVEKKLSIIEEAIGVKHLKIKREESIKKLEEVKTNLSEVKRLITEIEPNLEYLIAQKDKIEEQKKVREAYIDNLTLWLNYSLSEVNSKLTDIEKDLNTKSTNLKTTSRTIGTIRKELNNVRTADETKQKEQQKIQNEIENKSDLKDKLLRETYELRSKISEIRIETIQSIPVDKVYVAKEIKALIRSIESAHEVSVAQIKLNVLQNLKSLLTQLGKGEITIKKFDDTKKKLKVDLEKKFMNTEKDLKLQEITIKKLRAEYHSISNKINKRTQDESEILQKLEDARDHQHKMDRELDQLNYKHGQLVSKQQNLVEEIKTNNIQIKKNIKVDAKQAHKLKALVKNLKEQLQSIGYVDDAAIQEYAKVNERFKFLNDQYDDLKESRKETRQIVERLDKEISQKFAKSFTDINSNFDKLFQKMFGGGEAKLVIVKDEEGLQSGIDIHARMPRKKIPNVSLFSGGERALTSIALTLSLIYGSPPPFIVLDEVDAALDDSNSYRFSTILRDLAKKTQTIIITHNHETMTKAEVLYGIAMNNDGYSKVTSLALMDKKS